jgi:hypothetical protein
MNDENLIPTTMLTESERRELAIKAGKASGEARRRKKNMRENLLALLEMPLKKGEIQGFTSLEEASGKNVSVEDAILLTAVKKALKGDMRAIEFLRDTSGNRILGTVDTTEHADALNQLCETILGATKDE